MDSFFTLGAREVTAPICGPLCSGVTSELQLRGRVSTFRCNGRLLNTKKYQLVLIRRFFSKAFQAYDEGSIPFTRSNHFNYLRHGHRVILTSGLSVILTKPERLFAPRGVSWRRPRPAASCA
jgi:hypothetical protein